MDLLSAAEARALCGRELDGLGLTKVPLLGNVLDRAVSRCTGKVEGMTLSSAVAAIPNTLTGVLRWVGL